MKRNRTSIPQGQECDQVLPISWHKKRKLESVAVEDQLMDITPDHHLDKLQPADEKAEASRERTEPPQIGRLAPKFVAKQYLLEDGVLATEPLSLDQLRNGGYMLLVFYPLDFTFVCPTELTEFNRRLDEFRRLGCSVVAISQDSQYCHHHWSQMDRKRGGLMSKDTKFRLPIVSDMDKSIMRTYGVLLEESGVSLRGTFLIDSQGVLRHYHVNDLPVGRDVDECLRLVEAFQHVDKHGVVCPVGWKEGHKTIDTKQASSFFAESY